MGQWGEKGERTRGKAGVRIRCGKIEGGGESSFRKRKKRRALQIYLIGGGAFRRRGIFRSEVRSGKKAHLFKLRR